MMKKCVALDGKIINVGEWDYQKHVDDEGSEVVGNPLPEGAVVEERDFEYSEEYGWREVGYTPVSSDEVLKAKIELVTINTLLDLGVF